MPTYSEYTQIGEIEIGTPLQKDLAHKIISYFKKHKYLIGKKISVPALARQFNVSRTPITGALNILAGQGIIGPSKSRGFELRVDISKVDLKEIIPNSSIENLYREIMSDRALNKIPILVSETELIPRYNVSRGTIRKVLLRFASEGLATRQQGHGWHFAEALCDKESIRESYRFRISVECGALLEPEFTINNLQLVQVKCEHEDVINSKKIISINEWFEMNAEFHEMLTEFSGNRFFLSAMKQQNNLRRMKDSAIYERIPMSHIQNSCQEHLKILGAIEKGDNEWAAALMKQHLRSSIA